MKESAHGAPVFVTGDRMYDYEFWMTLVFVFVLIISAAAAAYAFARMVERMFAWTCFALFGDEVKPPQYWRDLK